MITKSVLLALMLAGCASPPPPRVHHPITQLKFRKWECSVVDSRLAPNRTSLLRSQAEVVLVTYACDGETGAE